MYQSYYSLFIMQVFPTVINCILCKANTSINGSQLWKLMLDLPEFGHIVLSVIRNLPGLMLCCLCFVHLVYQLIIHDTGKAITYCSRSLSHAC